MVGRPFSNVQRFTIAGAAVPLLRRRGMDVSLVNVVLTLVFWTFLPG
jgi:hypothetical protein